MKKYIIDTNALISFVTDRNPDQQKKIAPLFESAAHMKALILCHQYVLTEFIYVMDRVYHVPKDEIGRMIADFADMPGVEVLHEIDFKSVLSCWPDPIPDFGDAVIATICKITRRSTIVTFDQKFVKNLKSLGLNIFG
ncbi:MAG: type II toxin-antitoxin system VapC family toxin [Desulfobacteraceae bacterium]|nr:MAG: type II toxin-antitoxin system VapC family toxin [Desulfobacteraceae bacterium]